MNNFKTVALVSTDTLAFLRIGKDAEDIKLTQNEVRELAKVFRQCVERWDRQDSKKGKK